MSDTLDPKNVDKRTWERYARSGQLDEKAYERHNKSLPDSAEKSTIVETVMFEDEDLDEADADDVEEIADPSTSIQS